MSERKVWLNEAIIQCPYCGYYYTDASWYVIEIGSDIECGMCHKTFNTKKHVTDRIMLGLKIDEKGRVQRVEVAEHI
jgi:hypothetical protein